MGIGYNGLLALLKLKQEGCNFDKIATLGRHYLYLTHRELKKAFQQFGYSISNEDCARIFANSEGGNKGYQETLLKFLGAKEVVSFDASDYEKCTYAFDFNHPIPHHFYETFTCVLDFGSIEHVFNFPQAIKNLMDICKIGGHIAMETPNNNLGGHGFYQFCPELFVALFNDKNGFELEKMYLYFTNRYLRASKSRPSWYELVSSGRVDICDHLPSIMFFWAKKKLRSVELLSVKEPYYQGLYGNASSSKVMASTLYEKLKKNALLHPFIPVLKALRDRIFPKRQFKKAFRKTAAWKK